MLIFRYDMPVEGLTTMIQIKTNVFIAVTKNT